MVFKQKGAHVFKVRVTGRGRISRIFSTGTADRDVAEDVGRMVKTWRQRRWWAWLDLILQDRVKLPAAYDAWADGSIEPFMNDALHEHATPDLDQLVTEWGKRGADAKYVRQVRTLVPEGQRFPLSAFRRKTISDHLAGLALDVVTKRKYRTAFSMLAKWLIEQELLDTNPARDVALPHAKRRPIVFLEPEQQQLLINSHDTLQQRALEALMAGSMIEWQACERLTRKDIDPERRLVHAHGTKTERYGSFRDRWIEVTEDWCWQIFWSYARTFTPSTRIFDGLTNFAALERHQQRTKALNKELTKLNLEPLPETTLHQYRHAFAVLWIRRGATGGLREDGRDEQWLKNQAGHAPESTMIYTTYGPYIKAARMTAQQEARQRKEKKS